jgi:hypothetical protein
MSELTEAERQAIVFKKDRKENMDNTNELGDMVGVVDRFIKAKQLVVSQETNLVSDLNKALEKLGYRVVPLAKQGRPVGYSPKQKVKG